MSVELVMSSNHLILCRLLLLPSIFPSIRIFSKESVLPIRWPKCWSFSFIISPSNEYSGLIEYWLVGSPCSPRESQESTPTPQFKCINSLALSFLYSPTLTSIHDYWKTIALTRRTFVGKVMSLFFAMLSRLVIAFLPRRKHLLIFTALTICSDFGAQENKVSTFSIYLLWSDGTRCHDLSFLNAEF